MSRFFPRADLAEDQPYARTILYYHVIHRGIQTGALLGVFGGVISAAMGRSRDSLLTSLTRRAGVGAIAGAGLLGVGGTAARMWGREEIEWKDRSYRILWSRSQEEVDDFSVSGTVVGAAAAIVREGQQSAAGRAVRLVGGASLGNLAGVGAYMAWRYGVKGGKWD